MLEIDLMVAAGKDRPAMQTAIGNGGATRARRSLIHCSVRAACGSVAVRTAWSGGGRGAGRSGLGGVRACGGINPEGKVVYVGK